MSLAAITMWIYNNIFFTIAGLIGFSLTIAFHEFGHFLFCKLFNIKTPSFSIGFGPRLISKKIGDTEFAISAIPLGGYVEIAGASEVGQGDQKDAYSRDDRSFAEKPWYQKFLVLIAGILFNIIFAYAAICLLFMAGMPKTMLLYPRNAQPEIEMVVKESPAFKAGLQPHDKILTLDGQPITTENAPSVYEKIQAKPNQPISFHVARDGKEQDIEVVTGTKEFMGKTVGTAGIILAVRSLPPYSFLESIKKGIALTNSMLYMTVQGLGHLFSSGDTSNVQGPVKIIAATVQGAKEGFKTLILFLAIISLSLAVLNLVPLPILDGGQILFYTIEAIIGRPIPEKVREYIHIACWLGVLLLVVLLSYRDLKGLLAPYLDRITNLFSK